ncbi:MAG: hypothetical protein GY723_23665 [bacterium]|nr:hypothetical protein [bacterium]
MWRTYAVSLLLLTLAQPGHADGSFNRVSSPAQPEAESPAPEAEPVAPAAAPVPAAPAPEEEAPEVEPTRGKACIYGPKGLLHQPRGRKCKESGSSAAAASSEEPGRGRKGRCIVGTDGRVVYAPPGVSCEDALLGDPPPPEPRRPRARRLRF